MKQWTVMDWHCDVLYQLAEKGRSFTSTNGMQASFAQLKEGNVVGQVFAHWIPEIYQEGVGERAYLRQRYLFEKDVLPYLESVHPQFQYRLSLEGLTPLQHLPLNTLLQRLIEDQISIVHLTWNADNKFATGAHTKSTTGLSAYGRTFVKEWCKRGGWIDVSHLSTASFWDVVAMTDRVFASHSNANTCCPHPRNLTDDQLIELFSMERYVGLTFYPYFIDPQAKDEGWIYTHIDHMISLGGEDYLLFGSDFDGIDETFPMLETARDFPKFISEIASSFSPSVAEKMSMKNGERLLMLIPSKLN
ncbi:MAG: dipeptidase [Bacilli bacterium]